jgi:hypothetical protein
MGPVVVGWVEHHESQLPGVMVCRSNIPAHTQRPSSAVESLPKPRKGDHTVCLEDSSMKVHRRCLANDHKAGYVSRETRGHGAVSLEGRYLLETG